VRSLVRPIRFAGYQRCLIAVLLIGCKTDCVYYPCPIAEAITLSVSGGGAPGAPPGLTVAIGAELLQAGLCDAAGVCHIFGSPGAYRLTIAATGFVPRTLDVTVTGEAAGCNTCGHIDRQQLSVVLQPVTQRDRRSLSRSTASKERCSRQAI
jgi:hypothetical protein